MAKKLMSDLDRLWGKFLPDETTGCWVWTCRLDKDGYAGPVKVGSRTTYTRRMVRPHRWFYAWAKGPIPKDLQIDHLCRNRACVNPEHLEAVTALENHHRGLRALYAVCPKGHAIEGENELIRKGGGHRCRICFNEWMGGYQKRTDYKYQKAWIKRKQEAQSRRG